MIIIPCPDSAGARKGAKGSRNGGVRAVLGYHNFEQLPCDSIGFAFLSMITLLEAAGLVC